MKNIALVVLGVVIGGLVTVVFFAGRPGTGGELFMQKPSFVQGFYAGLGRQLSVSNTGAVTNSGSFTQSGVATFSGEVTLGNCGTATWNPVALGFPLSAATSTASTTVAVTNAAVGDSCLASLTSATSTQAVLLGCYFHAAASSTVTLTNVSGQNGLDLATGTVKVCYFD